MCTLFLWMGGRGSQKVYGLYTHENVDIYGWPLMILINVTACRTFKCNYLWNYWSDIDGLMLESQFSSVSKVVYCTLQVIYLSYFVVSNCS